MVIQFVFAPSEVIESATAFGFGAFVTATLKSDISESFNHNIDGTVEIHLKNGRIINDYSEIADLVIDKKVTENDILFAIANAIVN